MKASILTIGDEILNGSTVDTNSSFIAEKSIQLGIHITNILSVSDEKKEIIESLDFLSQNSKIIFITGGLGPTNDDITINTLALYLGVPLEFSSKIYEKTNKMLSKRASKKIEVDQSSCYFPKGALLLENLKGTAPGLWLKKTNTLIVSMPGVPLEMKQIFVDEVMPKLKNEFRLDKIINKYIMTVGIWESIIANSIKEIELNLPKNISLAYLPSIGKVKLRITGKNVLEEDVQEVVNQIAEKISPFIYSFDENSSIQKAVGLLLKSKGKTLSTAESCTGGKIAHKLTSVSGSSSYYEGSIVSYSNAVKRTNLYVKNATLKKYGAVSEETVIEMAKGAIKVLKTDYSIAISGIAGPDGGSNEKPVGTVFISVASNEKVETKRFQFTPFRDENIELSSISALNMLRLFI